MAMCKPQKVQLDCTVLNCKHNKGAGYCKHKSPEITLNPSGKYVCWTEKKVELSLEDMIIMQLRSEFMDDMIADTLKMLHKLQ